MEIQILNSIICELKEFWIYKNDTTFKIKKEKDYVYMFWWEYRKEIFCANVYVTKYDKKNFKNNREFWFSWCWVIKAYSTKKHFIWSLAWLKINLFF